MIKYTLIFWCVFVSDYCRCWSNSGSILQIPQETCICAIQAPETSYNSNIPRLWARVQGKFWGWLQDQEFEGWIMSTVTSYIFVTLNTYLKSDRTDGQKYIVWVKASKFKWYLVCYSVQLLIVKISKNHVQFNNFWSIWA